MDTRIRVAFSLLVTSLFLLGGSVATALSIDARIGGVFEDTTFTTPVAGAVIDVAGNVSNYAVQAGQGILVTIDIANPSADLISGIFVSMVVQSEKLNLIGSNAVAAILAGGTFFNPTRLTDIGSGAVKINSPPLPGEVWIQAVAYGSGFGSSGTGPEVSAVQLFFEVASGGQSDGLLDFDLRLTAGDAIGGAGSTTFSSTFVTVMPEPNTALLLGFGLAGLSAVQRRSSHDSEKSSLARTMRS